MLHSLPKDHRELRTLEAYKRRVYLISLILGMAIFMLSWFIRNPQDTFVAALYPAFAVLAGVLALLIKCNIAPLQRLERLLIIIVATMVLTRLLWHFHRGGPLREHLLALVGGHYWAVGALIVGTFVVLNLKGGLIAGSIIILLSAIIALTGIADDMWYGQVTAESLIYLARIHLFLLILLVLTSAATSLRDKLYHALSRADMLAQKANTDLLTELPNRRGAEQFLGKQIAAAKRYDRPIAVIMVDVDHFKRVNDDHGHDTGDRTLIKIAETLNSSVRESDFPTRWGGEEFLIVAQNTNLEEGRSLAERVRTAVAKQRFEKVGQVTISLGVAAWENGESKNELIKRADVAMYAAKKEGRNRVKTG